MAYDEGLLVREVVDPTVDVLEKKMFGGVAFMLRGNMAFGIIEDELMVRVGPDAYEEALAQPDVAFARSLPAK
ncbi:MAG: TfoX/Sxy family protein [Candidatus Latescibacterota bacterium]|jgi:TfoX/Sxy family transcriptional regulator of competence genes